MKKSLLILLVVFGLSSCGIRHNYTFELEGNPTTGYSWKCLSSDNKKMEVRSEYTSDDDSLVGVGGKYTFTLIGREKGEVTLTCKYKRSNEETEYDKEQIYNFVIDKDLNVVLQ